MFTKFLRLMSFLSLYGDMSKCSVILRLGIVSLFSSSVSFLWNGQCCAETTKPSAQYAVGVTVDTLPFLVSAAAREVGASGQLWGGYNHFRLRLVGAHMAFPDVYAARGGFNEQRLTVGAVILDYVNGEHFEGWWFGSGLEYWDTRVKRESTRKRHHAQSVMGTLGGGYIYRVWKNLYIEPWTAMHLRLVSDTVSDDAEVFEPNFLSGELSLKVGYYFEL